MSASKNPDAVIHQEGQFSSRVPGSEPMMKGGHKPGEKVSPNDHAPEFHAQTLPPGTAPPSSTYKPNVDVDNQLAPQPASETLNGATSKDVNTGLGRPFDGQTSQELHNKTKDPETAHIGQTTYKVVNDKASGKDPAFALQRNLEKDAPAGHRGKVLHPPAEDRLPEGPEEAAKASKSKSKS